MAQTNCRTPDVDETIYSSTEISDFIDTMNQIEIESPTSIRQQIIKEYPRLKQLMIDKKLNRRELHRYLCEKSNVKMGEKTFYTYMAAGKEAFEKQEKEAAKQARLAEKAQQSSLLSQTLKPAASSEAKIDENDDFTSTKLSNNL